MKTFLSIILAASFVFGPVVSFAQSDDDSREPASEKGLTPEERARVKKRLYPGGRDEEPLQVQEQLTVQGQGGSDEPADPADYD